MPKIKLKTDLSINDAFDNFILSKRAQGITDKTVETYKGHLSVDLAPAFYAWVATVGKKMRIEAPKDAVKGMKDFIAAIASMYE